MINKFFGRPAAGLAMIYLAFLPLASASAEEKAMQLSKAEKAFIKEAYAGGMGEVKVGELAKSKATTPEARTLANRLIADHQQADGELKKLAKSKGMALPAEPAPEAQAAYKSLEKKEGTEFDRTFAQEAVTDHKKDIAKFEKIARETHDADLKAFIEKTLPILKEHLALAKAAEGNGR